MKFNKRLHFTAWAILAFSTAGFLLAQDDAVHLSQIEAVKAAKERPAPDYPPMAKQLHLEGEVKVLARISETGAVEDVKPITGNAVLAGAAVSAMRRWKFTPLVTDGKARKVVTEMSFSFKL